MQSPIRPPGSGLHTRTTSLVRLLLLGTVLLAGGAARAEDPYKELETWEKEAIQAIERSLAKEDPAAFAPLVPSRWRVDVDLGGDLKGKMSSQQLQASLKSFFEPIRTASARFRKRLASGGPYLIEHVYLVKGQKRQADYRVRLQRREGKVVLISIEHS